MKLTPAALAKREAKAATVANGLPLPKIACSTYNIFQQDYAAEDHADKVSEAGAGAACLTLGSTCG